MLQNVAGLACQPGNILQHTFGFMRYGIGVGVGVGVGIPVGAGVGVKIGTGVRGRLLPQAANVLREQPSIRSCQLLEGVVITRICCNFVCELLPLPLTLTTA